MKKVIFNLALLTSLLSAGSLNARSQFCLNEYLEWEYSLFMQFKDKGKSFNWYREGMLANGVTLSVCLGSDKINNADDWEIIINRADKIFE